MYNIQIIGLCLLTGLTFAQNGGQTAAPETRREIGNLIVENIPALPADLLERVEQYQNVRGASFADWDRDTTTKACLFRPASPTCRRFTT